MMPIDGSAKGSLFQALHKAEEPLPAARIQPEPVASPAPTPPPAHPEPPPGWEARVADLEKRLAEAQRLTIEATVRLNERDEAQRNALRETEKLLESVSASRRNEDRDQRAFALASEHERRLSELESHLRAFVEDARRAASSGDQKLLDLVAGQERRLVELESRLLASAEDARRAAAAHEAALEPFKTALAASCARVEALATKVEETSARLEAMDKRLAEAQNAVKAALRESGAEAERALMRMRAAVRGELEEPSRKALELTHALVTQYGVLREKIEAEAEARRREFDGLRRHAAPDRPADPPPPAPAAGENDSTGRLALLIDRETEELRRRLDDAGRRPSPG